MVLSFDDLIEKILFVNFVGSEKISMTSLVACFKNIEMMLTSKNITVFLFVREFEFLHFSCFQLELVRILTFDP